MADKLLEIKDLEVLYKSGKNPVHAVNGISLTLNKGETLGLVGETGAGKTTTALAILRLLPERTGCINQGQILFEGCDLLTLSEEEMRTQIRGEKISMIFQDPMSYLNPIVTIEKQMTEGIRAHDKCSKQEARERAIELMKMVGIPAPESRLKQYPFEFSGGMRQRIIIAIALACNPKLIVADEPTTALDVTVQAQILDLLRKITEESDAGVIIITHDLGVVASLCDRISIMYGGNIMEEGTTDEIFYDPKHPYTKGLLNSIANSNADHREPLKPIPGTPPDLLKLGDQCPFASRCSEAMEICTKATPLVTEFGETHKCKCWLHSKERWQEVMKGEDAHE